MMRILAAALFCMVAATAARAQTETTYTLSNGLGQTYAFHAFTCAGAYCTASVPMDAATGNPLTGIAGTPPGYGMSVQGMSGMTPLQVECQSGCGVSSSNFSNPFPAVGLAVGASNGTNMLPLLVDTSGYLEVDVKTSALPAGAATAANQVTMITALGSPFQAGGSIGNSSFGATQSGSWTVTANLGTLGGAATAANQTASYGTAGSPASTVVSVQGVPSGTAVVVSAAALPLPTNAAEETGGNLAVIAGAVSSSVVQSNVKQVGGTAASTGAGAVGSGSQRVAVAQDVTTLAGSAPGTAGTPSVNVVSVQGVSSGTAVPVSATALPLPTGAATQTTLAAVLSALGTPMQNSGGSVTANLGTLGGAATAANQTSVQGTAGSPASTVVSVQGVSGGAAVPVSAASLPLPSGAATAANQEVTVAGSSALSAQAVQGVTGGVALPVSATALPLPTNAAQETGGNLATIAGAVTSSVVQTNMKQVNGVTTLAGAGAVGTGAQRVAIGQDTTTVAGSAPGTAGSPSTNVVSVQGVTSGTAVPVSAAALPLPSGAATAANQTVVQGTAGSPATAVVSVQGVSGGTSLPVSAAALPLPSGAATAANQTVVQGTAGSPASTVLSVQGVSGGTPTPVSASSLPLPTGAATAANQTAGSQYGNQANWVSGTGNATGTSATTIIAAPSANKLYITSAQCFRTDAGTTADYVTFNDTASTPMGLANSGGGGGNNMVFSTPLVVATTTAFKFTANVGVSTILCNAQGYNAP